MKHKMRSQKIYVLSDIVILTGNIATYAGRDESEKKLKSEKFLERVA